MQWRQAEAEAATACVAEEKREKEAKERRKAAVRAERKRRLQETEEEKRQAEAAFKEAQACWETARQLAEWLATSPSSPTLLKNIAQQIAR